VKCCEVSVQGGWFVKILSQIVASRPTASVTQLGIIDIRNAPAILAIHMFFMLCIKMLSFTQLSAHFISTTVKRLVGGEHPHNAFLFPRSREAKEIVLRA